MLLRSINLTAFKNHHRKAFRFEDGVNCFTGANGIGKTNLLDAIYVLCLTKSYFSSSEQQNIPHENDFFRIEGSFENQEEDFTILCKYQNGKRKQFEENGIAYGKLSEHIGKIPVVITSPNDQELITGGSDERRKFLDITLSQINPEYLQQLSHYTKTLFQRNAALKKFAETGRYNKTLIETYDAQLIPAATYIFEARKKWVPHLKDMLKTYYANISGEKESAGLSYESSLEKTSMEQLLKEKLQEDRMLQRTSSGIHRDELIFELDNYPVKKFGSQGQQKSFLLSLKLAQYSFLKKEKNIKPLLLLDDLFDKLDRQRCAFILELLFGEELGQVFITDTNEEKIKAFFYDKNKPLHIYNLEKPTTDE